MDNKVISIQGEDKTVDKIPPFTHTLIEKILFRNKFSEAQKEIYDILIQSTDQKNADKPDYYKRAYAINPSYMRYLFNTYNNTDIQDLQELLIELPHLYKKYGARYAYIDLEGENHYKKVAGRDMLQFWLKNYISDEFIKTIEQKVLELGKRNLYEISFTLQQDGVKIWLSSVTDTDGDVLEKNKKGGIDASAYSFPYSIKLDSQDAIARFIRKVGGNTGDIEDLIIYE